MASAGSERPAWVKELPGGGQTIDLLACSPEEMEAELRRMGLPAGAVQGVVSGVAGTKRDVVLKFNDMRPASLKLYLIGSETVKVPPPPPGCALLLRIQGSQWEGQSPYVLAFQGPMALPLDMTGGAMLLKPDFFAGGMAAVGLPAGVIASVAELETVAAAGR